LAGGTRRFRFFFAGRSTAGLLAELKKNRKVGLKQKNTFFATTATEMILKAGKFR
jgi:hypothetical protein